MGPVEERPTEGGEVRPTPGEYRNNHYVPVWYQKRFLAAAQKNRELFYLKLHPEMFKDSRGRSHVGNAVRQLGFKHCFAERDLYTTRFGADVSTRVERLFFGEIDSKGKRAVEYWTGFGHPSVDGEALTNLMLFMSAQKLRTPKGLAWLSEAARTKDHEQALRVMLEFRQLHCAIWTECVWIIADASRSPTKFIVSDHPVTVYNRRCGPRSQWCRGANDPDTRLHGTHTIFPLALDKVLLLTNLSWVRNPYKDELGVRPNPNPFRNAIFNFTSVQTLRYLDEAEVRTINYIIKSRAYRFVAAGEKEWLFPERFVSKSDWRDYGHGYLLMPDPRSVTYGGEIFFGYRDGTSSAFDEYGHRPWDPAYRGDRKGPDKDWFTFLRFQGQFARLFGPSRRGRAFNHGTLDPERDSDDFHRYHLEMEAEPWKRRSS